MKKIVFFLIILVASGIFSGCGSSGGSSSSPYSGSFNVFLVPEVGRTESLLGTCQINQNGTGGSATFTITGGAPLSSSSVSFNNTQMTINFGSEAYWILFSGTWTSTALFEGTYSNSALVMNVPMRLRRQ